MTILEPTGLIALVGGILAFFGGSYLVVALNLGWRFGWWVWGACLGGLGLILSLFWVLTGLGPRGEEPLWIPLAASRETISEVEFNDATFTSPREYPAGRWQDPEREESLAEHEDPLQSALSACTAFNDERVEQAETEIENLKIPERTWLEAKIGRAGRAERELEVCRRAYEFLPERDSLPKIEGEPVAYVPEPSQIRFTEENGVLLGQAIIVPNTYDRRVTGDPEKAQAVGEPFRVVAYLDPGSLRTPALGYLIFSLLWMAFHLWGLNRAEKQQLSPVAA
jgi:hypothetical protein